MALRELANLSCPCIYKWNLRAECIKKCVNFHGEIFTQLILLRAAPFL